jgi:hypothetical protein
MFDSSSAPPLPKAEEYRLDANGQAVLQLLGPLKFLSNLPDVGKLFQQAEQDRKTVQEMVAGEMDA